MCFNRDKFAGGTEEKKKVRKRGLVEALVLQLFNIDGKNKDRQKEKKNNNNKKGEG